MATVADRAERAVYWEQPGENLLMTGSGRRTILKRLKGSRSTGASSVQRTPVAENHTLFYIPETVNPRS